jgi:hypothetical protein
MGLAVAGILWSTIGLFLVVALVAAIRNSWRLMMLATLFSLVFSVAATFSIGPYTLLLTNLALASALGFRWHFQGIGWTLTMTAALAIWILTVPLQLLVFHWPPLQLFELLALLVAAVATFLGPRHSDFLVSTGAE